MEDDIHRSSFNSLIDRFLLGTFILGDIMNVIYWIYASKICSITLNNNQNQFQWNYT